MTIAKKAGAKALAPAKTTGKKPKPGGSARDASKLSDAIGFWIDGAAPKLADLLEPHGIVADDFERWLGPKIAVYRGSMQAVAAMPQPSAEREVLRAILSHVEAIAPQLRPFGLPGRIEPGLFMRAKDANVNWDELRDRLASDLIVLQLIVAREIALRSTGEPKRGRRSLTKRDQLLSDIVERLRASSTKAAVARSLAEQILIRCRVEVPANPDSVRKAAGRASGTK